MTGYPFSVQEYCLMKFSRRLVLVAAALALVGTAAQAQQFFRIGTGGTAGTYFPVGGMIANTVSQPGKIASTAQASAGSVANVNAVAAGQLESGFSQADVATWAHTGTGVWEGRPPVAGLRLIANLYPESVHIVARKGAGIKTVADLKGKRVALDEPGSGTLINARSILAAYGLKDSDLRPEYIKPNQRLVFREGRTKAVGNVVRPIPHTIPTQPSHSRSKPLKMQQRFSQQVTCFRKCHFIA